LHVIAFCEYYTCVFYVTFSDVMK